jgi:hypothetical protein
MRTCTASPAAASHSRAAAGAAVLTLALVAAACEPQARVAERAAADAAELTTASASRTAVDPAAGSLRACVNLDDGYPIRYPVEWYVNHPDAARACSLFGPGIVTATHDAAEPAGAVISISFAYNDFATFAERAAVAGEGGRETLTVAGRDALRVYGETTGDDGGPAGVPWYEYVVSFNDDRVLIARTYETGTIPFAQKRRVLDAMTASLTLH